MSSKSAEADLAEKYRELREKHARLLEQLESRDVVVKLARWTLQSSTFAVALAEGGVVAAASPAWKDLDDPAAGGWRREDEIPGRVASLSEVLHAGAAGPDGAAGVALVRESDARRIRLRIEPVSEGEGTRVGVALDGSPTAHRARNHLAAATLQAHLLRNVPGASEDVLRRATLIADLIHRAAVALDPTGTDSRGPT